MCSMPLYIKTNPWVYPSQAKVKFCVVYLKTVFISTKSRFSRASFAYPSCFYFFSPSCFPPFGITHSAHFHPGFRILPSFWGFPFTWQCCNVAILQCCNLVMLSITGLLLSSLGELKRRCVHTSNKK